MNRDIADPVLAFVERLCNAPSNRFGADFLPEHLLVVERFARQLATVLHADAGVVRAAALLHDIAAIQDAALVPVHAERGAELVVELCGPAGPLRRAPGIDPSQVERIATCVREHSSPKRLDETIPESVCVSNADAMSQIARPVYWLRYARTFKGLSYPQAVMWYRDLVEKNWNSLIEEAREILAADYATTETYLQHETESIAAVH